MIPAFLPSFLASPWQSRERARGQAPGQPTPAPHGPRLPPILAGVIPLAAIILSARVDDARIVGACLAIVGLAIVADLVSARHRAAACSREEHDGPQDHEEPEEHDEPEPPTSSGPRPSKRAA